LRRSRPLNISVRRAGRSRVRGSLDIDTLVVAPIEPLVLDALPAGADLAAARQVEVATKSRLKRREGHAACEFNAGVMVVRPSLHRLSALLNGTLQKPANRSSARGVAGMAEWGASGEQPFLNEQFVDACTLPQSANANLALFRDARPSWNATIVHYEPFEKPWELQAKVGAWNRSRATLSYADVYVPWMDISSAALSRLSHLTLTRRYDGGYQLTKDGLRLYNALGAASKCTYV
jgi:hypothetical protein